MRVSEKWPGESRRLITLLLPGLMVTSACGGGKAPSPTAPTPVAVATATLGPEALTLSGLGHVQGLMTASARAQTGGQLVSVNFVEGQPVRAGTPLAQIDPRPLQATLAQAMAALARDQAALANARDNLARSAPLVEQGLASAQQVETYRSQAAQLAAAIAGDRAQIQRDRLALAYATVRAPITGITGIRLIDPGNVVSPNDATGIVTVSQVQPIAALFTVPQSAIAAIRTAVAASGPSGVEIVALAQENEEPIDHGRLLTIDNRIDPGTGTIALKAIFPNANRQLWPGQQITARLILSRNRAVTLPASAIQNNSKGTFVWIVGKTGTVTLRQVATGPQLGDRIIIARGVSGGETVVTDGQFALRPGARVAIAGHGGALKSDNPARLGLQP